MEILNGIAAELQHDWLTAIIVCAVIAFAYTAFAATGFGGAAIATPFLVLRLPVPMVVPLLAVFDIVAASINIANIISEGYGKGLQGRIDFTVIAILTPTLLCGTYIGTNFLRAWPANYILLAFGIFVFTTTVLNLRDKQRPRVNHSAFFGLFVGLVGGILSGTFGVGGPLYALYMSNRLVAAKVAGTLGTLIGISACARALIFLHQGIYSDIYLSALIVAALPFLLLGMVGTHFAAQNVAKLTIVRYLRYLLLLVSTSIMARALYQFFQ